MLDEKIEIIFDQESLPLFLMKEQSQSIIILQKELRSLATMLFILIVKWINNENAYKIDDNIKDMNMIHFQHKMLIIGNIDNNIINSNIKTKARLILDNDPNIILVYYLPEEEFEAYPRKYKWRYKGTLPLVYLTIDHIRSLYKKRKYEVLPDYKRHTIFIRLDSIQINIIKKMKYDQYMSVDQSFACMSFDDDPDESFRPNNISKVVYDYKTILENRLDFIHNRNNNSMVSNRILDIEDKMINIKQEVVTNIKPLLSDNDRRITHHYMTIVSSFLICKYKMEMIQKMETWKKNEDIILKRTSEKRKRALVFDNLALQKRKRNIISDQNTSGISSSFISRGGSNKKSMNRMNISIINGVYNKKRKSVIISRSDIDDDNNSKIINELSDPLTIQDNQKKSIYHRLTYKKIDNDNESFKRLSNPRNSLILSVDNNQAIDKSMDLDSLITKDMVREWNKQRIVSKEKIEDWLKPRDENMVKSFDNGVAADNRLGIPRESDSASRNRSFGSSKAEAMPKYSNLVKKNEKNMYFGLVKLKKSKSSNANFLNDKKTSTNMRSTLEGNKIENKITVTNLDISDIKPEERKLARQDSMGVQLDFNKKLVKMGSMQIGELRPESNIKRKYGLSNKTPVKVQKVRFGSRNNSRNIKQKRSSKIRVDSLDRLQQATLESDSNSKASKIEEFSIRSGVYKEIPLTLKQKIITAYPGEALEKSKSNPDARIIKISNPEKYKLYQIEPTVGFEGLNIGDDKDKDVMNQSYNKSNSHQVTGYLDLLENPIKLKKKEQTIKKLREQMKIFVSDIGQYEEKSLNIFEKLSEDSPDQKQGTQQHFNLKEEQEESKSFTKIKEEECESGSDESYRQRKMMMNRLKENQPSKSYAQSYFYGDFRPRSETKNFERKPTEGSYVLGNKKSQLQLSKFSKGDTSMNKKDILKDVQSIAGQGGASQMSIEAGGTPLGSKNERHERFKSVTNFYGNMLDPPSETNLNVVVSPNEASPPSSKSRFSKEPNSPLRKPKKKGFKINFLSGDHLTNNILKDVLGKDGY